MEYTTLDNPLTANDLNDRCDKMVDLVMCRLEDNIGNATREGSIVKPAEFAVVTREYWGFIANCVRKGEGYSDDYIDLRYNINGVFANEADSFDPLRHTLVITVKLKSVITRGSMEVMMKFVLSWRRVLRSTG